MSNVVNHTQPEIQEDVAVMVAEGDSPLNYLILWNDDVNTFDWVIESLMDVCSHSETQATQCAYIVHYNGKCDAKRGTFEELKPMYEALIDRGISVTIDN